MADLDMDCFDDGEDSFFTDVNLDEIMAMTNQSFSNSDKENEGSKNTKDVPVLPVVQGRSSSRWNGKGQAESVPKPQPSAVAIQNSPLKKRFKFFKSAPTPCRENPPSPIGFDEESLAMGNEDDDVQVIEPGDGFDDDGDDYLFSEMDLNGITELKNAATTKELKNKTPQLQVKLKPKALMESPSKHYFSYYPTLPLKRNFPKMESPIAPGGKKRFKFKGKTGTLASYPNFPSTSTPKKEAKDELLEIDSEIQFIEEVQPSMNCPEQPPQPSRHPIKRTNSDELLMQRDQYFKEVRNNDWRKFLTEMMEQARFGSLPFQSMPIIALNMSQFESIITTCLDVSVPLLIKVANLLLSFLKEMHKGTTLKKDCMQSNDVEFDVEYHNGLVQLLESTIVRIDCLLKRDDTKDNEDTMTELFKRIMEQHSTGSPDLSRTLILPFVPRYYPEGFTIAVNHAVETGTYEKLVPFCLKAPKNFVMILNRFSIISLPIIEIDPDFKIQRKIYSKPAPGTMTNELIKTLFAQLPNDAVSCFPSQVQGLVVFEKSISMQWREPKKVYDRYSQIVAQVFNLVEYCAGHCYNGTMDEKFLTLLISSLPNVNRILSDKSLTNNVSFKQWPYLWKYLKRLNLM